MFLFLFGIISACNLAKKLPDNSYLLHKTKVNIDNKKIDREELVSILKQTPNRKILALLRFHLWAYNFGNKKETKIRSFFKNTIGEPPVILDESLTKKSKEQLEIYLKNKGYFNGNVTDTTLYFPNKKKAEVHYLIKANNPYTIKSIILSITDTNLLEPMKLITKKSLLKPGNNYDVDIIQAERTRVTNEMRGLGYYKFSQEYIYFQIDSNLLSNRVTIKQVIKNPVKKEKINGNDSLVESTHELYYIKKVVINTNYDPKIDFYDQGMVLNHSGFEFINVMNMEYRQDVILKSIFIKPNKLFRIDDITYTHKRLSALKTFKFINISFDEQLPDENGKNQLICNINLGTAPKQSFTIETEGTNRSGNLGVAGNITYRNKNTFRGAEVWELKLKGGIEAQKLATSTEGSSVFENSNLKGADGIPFNTLEYGLESTIYFQNMFLLKKLKPLEKLYNPNTSIGGLYNFQIRPDFIRTISNMTFGYNWKTSTNSSHSFFPFDFSSVKIDKEKTFEDELKKINNPFYSNSFNDHLIGALRYTYAFSNQDINKFKNYVFFRSSLESAGNLLRFAHESFGTKKDSLGSFRIFNIRYAQYIRGDIDLRLYNTIDKHSNMVYRIYIGLGVPYKNFSVLPFEKSYFSGGANGIRAWQSRKLGPGSYFNPESTVIDRIGDIQLEGNMEYRFDILKVLEGAVFVDAGNIWLLKKDLARLGGDFRINEFLNEIAIGTGLGLRLDLNFFIIRTDFGFPLKNPILPKGERWIFQSKDVHNENLKKLGFNNYKTSPVFNFGIGYPF